MTALPRFDTDFTRAQFPAFSEPALQGQAFFENAGGSYTCAQVIARLTRFYHQRKVQPYSAYEASRLGGEEMDEARSRLAAMMGIDGDELSFGPSTTANTYVLSQAFRQSLKSGDAVVVTNQDHEANSGAWRRLAEAGIEIREWQIDPETGHLDPARLADLLADGRVKLVAFPHCSNVVGEINDVASITALVRAAGAVSCVDGVSYAPHGLPDIPALGADIYLFSAYKTYGPHQGIMVIRRAVAEALPNQAHHFNGDVLYKRFTPAGPDHAQVAACAGMADYIEALHDHHFPAQTSRSPREKNAAVHALMRAQERALSEPLLAWMSARNDLRLLGPRNAEGRAPTFALDLGRAAAPVAADLAQSGIMAGSGNFYAQRPLQAMGVDPAPGVLRLSFTHYTSEAEIAQLISALERHL